MLPLMLSINQFVIPAPLSLFLLQPKIVQIALVYYLWLSLFPKAIFFSFLQFMHLLGSFLSLLV